MSDHPERRASDPLLLEVRDMMIEMRADMRGHVRWDEEHHAAEQKTLDSVDARLASCERFKTKATAYGVIVSLIMTGLLFAAGETAWGFLSRVAKEPLTAVSK